MRIGLVGLGKMGAAIAARLVEKNFSLIGWDADPSRLAILETLGQEVADSAAAVAASADPILSIITDDAGVRALYAGKGGFLEAEVTGKLFVEMSTVRPATADALSPLVGERGASFVESPVMGTIPAARGGTLLALAAGEAADVERATTVLAALTRRVVYLGPAGRGYAMKLCANLLMASFLQALAESTALGTRAGLSLEQVLEILQESPVASPWLQTKLPILRGGEGAMSLDIGSLRKDVMAAVATGAELGVAMPGASSVLTALSAAVAHGEGERDLAHYARFFRENMVRNPSIGTSS